MPGQARCMLQLRLGAAAVTGSAGGCWSAVLLPRHYLLLVLLYNFSCRTAMCSLHDATGNRSDDVDQPISKRRNWHGKVRWEQKTLAISKWPDSPPESRPCNPSIPHSSGGELLLMDHVAAIFTVSLLHSIPGFSTTPEAKTGKARQ